MNYYVAITLYTRIFNDKGNVPGIIKWENKI